MTIPTWAHSLPILLAVMLLPCANALAEPVELNVPIQMRGAIGQDACPEQGRVSGIQEGLEGSTPVHSGPGEGFRLIGRLRLGNSVFVCERLGAWLGVVYGSEPLGCQTRIILPTSGEYSGPCDRGWVAARDVSIGND